ncbi:uncharacterized protein SPSK_02005 [Sporothrix schenckii 1099-18]|uniref:Fungal N-terminal domain-containing protein n=1 Tax=Sporothrix schenckii 1099-18 TaxID=1397361 RepID=A0A0F2MCB1_SPOSC|nr:uncharacterized protein SPSK_02005 [Sporothrix schenckii 1099-18]KJR87282.1 hypothetical protein SPSK_02005 [Sporothrix schenckii 1099-18]
MDPITALSVAAAAGQFVSFAYDLAKGTAERYRSIEGTEKRFVAVAADAKHINELLDALSTPNDVTGGTGSFVKSRTTSTLTTKLDAIVQECHAVGVELQTLLDSTAVQPSEKRRMVQSVRVTFRSMRKDSEISRLHERLRYLREHVDSCLIMLLCLAA